MARMTQNFRFWRRRTINSAPSPRHLISLPRLPSLSPHTRSLSWSTSAMAARCSGRINWDTLGDEAEEDAGELNYDYEWIVPDPGFGCLMNYPCSELFVLFLRLIGFGLFADVQETATSGRRRGGRLGLAGGVRSGRTGMGGGSGHGGQSTNGNGGEEGHGHAGVGGHADAGQAHHGYGYVLDAREGLGETLLDGRHGLAHQGAVHCQPRHDGRSWRGRRQRGRTARTWASSSRTNWAQSSVCTCDTMASSSSYSR